MTPQVTVSPAPAEPDDTVTIRVTTDEPVRLRDSAPVDIYKPVDEEVIQVNGSSPGKAGGLRG